jgi:hypothetical protein
VRWWRIPFCGDGTIAIETALSYPDVRVTASDIDPVRLTPAGRLCLLAGVQLNAPDRLRRLKYRVTLATQARLAGRVLHVLLCAPPRQARPDIPDGLAGWRRRALAEGVVTEAGF